MGPKRKQLPCPNPLFLKWLQEWKDDAEEKGLNSKWTFAKAISSIKKYPLPLRSGKEAKILENIGDGIAKKLDKRLGEYLQNGGDMSDLHFVMPLPEKSPPKKRAKKKTKDDPPNIPMPFSPDAKFVSPNARKYIPKYRSGAYALIVTLYTESQRFDYPGFLGKNELQEKARQLSDKSFTLPDAGSHYTAWSSMNTLTEKGLILKKSSPAKYLITESGCELAHHLLNGGAIRSPVGSRNVTSGAIISPENHNVQPKQKGKTTATSANDERARQLRELADRVFNPASDQNTGESPPLPFANNTLRNDNGNNESFYHKNHDLFNNSLNNASYSSATIYKNTNTAPAISNTNTNKLTDHSHSNKTSAGVSNVISTSNHFARLQVRLQSKATKTSKTSLSVSAKSVQKEESKNDDLPAKSSYSHNTSSITSASKSEDRPTKSSYSHNTSSITSASKSEDRPTKSSYLHNTSSITSASKSEDRPTKSSYSHNTSSIASAFKSEDRPTKSSYSHNTSSITSASKSEDRPTKPSYSQNDFGIVDLDSSYTSPKSLGYWYLDENGKETLNKSKALVSFNDIFGLGFVIKTRKNDLESSGALFVMDESRKAVDGFDFAVIADKDCKETATPPFERKPSTNSCTGNFTTSKHQPTFPSSKAKFPTTLPESAPVKDTRTNSSTTSKKSSTTLPKASVVIDIEQNSSTSSTKPPTHTFQIPTVVNIEDDRKCQSSTLPQSSAIISIDCDSQSSMEASDLSTLTPLFTLCPGNFDIVLCVDNTETTGSGKRKKEMAERLSKSDLPMDRRKLQLGDFLWVAREKTGSHRELVFDFIVERKRMDDLASSICDGRFKEQKYRLKHCGLKKLIYLVEAYGNSQHFQVPEKTLRQAINNTQVHDGLFIKETGDVFESAEYLKLITSELHLLYKDKTLHAIDMKELKEKTKEMVFDELIERDEQYLCTFEQFSSQTDKNKVLSVREVFTKQLMQFKGMSGDRAIAITQQFSTPKILIEALENCDDIDEKENLVTNIIFGKGKRKIGAPLSKQLNTFYAHAST